MSALKSASRISPIGRRLLVGMIGGGEESVIAASHISGIRIDAWFNIVAACVDSASGRAFAEGLGVAADRSYSTHARMIEMEAARPDGVDAVAILTPNCTHLEFAADFVDAGIHILCELLAIDIAPTRTLAADAQCPGVARPRCRDGPLPAGERCRRSLTGNSSLGWLFVSTRYTLAMTPRRDFHRDGAALRRRQSNSVQPNQDRKD